MNGRVIGVLRIFTALIILISLIMAGYLSRSPWIVVLAAPALTLLYILGKLSTWRMIWQHRGIKTSLQNLLVTLPVQMILGSVLYLIGIGLGRFFAPQPFVAFGWGDVIGVGSVLAICLICALAILFLEEKTSTARYSGEPELEMDPAPLTPATFYKSAGYWYNAPSDEQEQSAGKWAPAASEAEILAAEQRLGFQLPEGLRRLYRIQDGGYVGEVYVALKPNPGPFYDDWRGAFSFDYSSLYRLADLRTVYDLYQDFSDDSAELPANADRLLVLQARYGDMTLLDYSQPGEPRVTLVDFDNSGYLADATFASFDDFFSALRRPK